LPCCDDLPINELNVSLHFPENYSFSEFEGLREVSYLSGIVPQPQSSDSTSTAKTFYFTEHIVKKSITMRTEYKAKSKSWFKRRHLW